ncbi:putative transesterase [Mycena sanguinolenta]|uniref:Putative transesterase n=1 Tax=Mycena sanguinolenta TaxID=230812 RepID=A0A8H7D1M2_9AGAR|nr:putative transesterase [Mycena sanguinolenta]
MAIDDSIETGFQAAIDARYITGAVICATDADGQFVYNNALGERTLLSGERQAQQLDDVLCIASATKLLTTIAALQCVDDGLLDLTGDLSTFAPELTSKLVLSADGESLEKQTRPITLEMLLTHTSGSVYDFTSPPVARWHAVHGGPPPEPGARRSVEEFFDYPHAFQPGAGWMYGPGLDWAGRIVERVTHRTLGEHMHARIFAPLGIVDAAFYPVSATRPDLLPRLANRTPADPDALGLAVMGPGGASLNTRTAGDFGGHGIYISTADYLKVLQALLRNDGTLLKCSTVDAMFADHLDAVGDAVRASHAAALAGPIGAAFRVGTELGARVGHGLGGLLTLEDVPGWYGAGTLTWGGGQTFAWFVDRKNGLCGVGAVQSSIPINIEAVSALKDISKS